MTSQYEYEDDAEQGEPGSPRLEEIVRHVKQIHKKLNGIASRLDDNYHLLREVFESVTTENTVSERDL